MAVMAALVGTTTVVGAGNAAAGQAVSGTSTGTVSTHTGDTISIRGSAVSGQVKQAVTEAKQAGLLGISAQMNPDKAASEMSKVSSIKVGHMPNSASTRVSGSAIGDAVVKLVRSGKTDPITHVPKNRFEHSLGMSKSQFNDVVKRIDNKVSGTSGLTAKAVDYRAPSMSAKRHTTSTAPSTTTKTKQQKRKQAAAGKKSAPNSVALGGGRSAQKRDYSATPTGSGVSGAYAPPPKQRYGVPGYAPTAGKLDGKGGKQQAGGKQADPVYTAGHASKLADKSSSGSPKQVGVPMLIAVIALAGVSAGLVRTWALRRL